MLRFALACSVLGAVLSTAGPAAAADSPAEPRTDTTTTDALRVTLLWAAPVDLDLYVTDPGQETVYFANTPSRSGGRLVEDVTCKSPRTTGDAAREVVAWPSAAAGRYRVGIDFGHRCDHNAPNEVGFRVVADHDGRREEKVGRLGFERFDAVVLEIDLGSGAGASPSERSGAETGAPKDGEANGTANRPVGRRP